MTLVSNTFYGREHETLEIRGLRFHVTFAGPKDGAPLLLLHGFPEFWYGWRHQIPALAEAGYRVIVPDQRGYNLSDKPRRIAEYRAEVLTEDILGIIDALECDRVSLVGHDWGGAVAWGVASRFTERIDRLTVLNCPHPAVMHRHLLRNPRQMLRSWYILYFQLPWLPEFGMRARSWLSLSRTLQKMSQGGSFTDDDLAHYRMAWSQPGAMTAMINWYRALGRSFCDLQVPGRIEVPTLLIWGEKDTALGPELAPDSVALCDAGRLELLPDAGHFVQHDAPNVVNKLLLEFLDTNRESRP